MNKQKNLLIVLGEWWEQRQAAFPPAPTRKAPGHLWHILSWFVPNGGTLLLIAILLLTQNVWARPAASPAAPGPSATTVNYQGRLADNGGSPINDTVGMSFSLWDAATDGNLIWGPENHAALPVSDGLFSVGLGSQTAGGIPTTTWNGDRYLEIAVGGETLSPRELIRSVPVAGMALTVPDDAVTSRKINLASGAFSKSGGSAPLTTSPQGVPGTSATIVADTTLIVVAYGVFDFGTDNDTTAIGELWVDGSKKGRQAIQRGGRSSVAQVYRFQVSPGTHTLQLYAYKAGSGSASVNFHTTLTWFVISQ